MRVHVCADQRVAPEFSQIFLSGAIPIYLGAPNIGDYAPGDFSFINANDFSSAEELVSYIKYLVNDEKAYLEHFEWKKSGLLPSFENHLDHCAHFAECRLCKAILNKDSKDAKNK